MSSAHDHDAILAQQGSTFLWTEGYGHTELLTRLREQAATLVFTAAALVLAAGAAQFLSMQFGL